MRFIQQKRSLVELFIAQGLSRIPTDWIVFEVRQSACLCVLKRLLLLLFVGGVLNFNNDIGLILHLTHRQLRRSTGSVISFAASCLLDLVISVIFRLLLRFLQLILRDHLRLDPVERNVAGIPGHLRVGLGVQHFRAWGLHRLIYFLLPHHSGR